MSHFIYIVFTCIIFFSCKKDSPSDCTEDVYAYEFYSSAKIDTTTTPAGIFFQVNPGNDIIFSYTHIGPDCKSIVDEEFTDRLVFKVPAGSSSFLYENSQLTGAMCLFIKYAFWTNGAYQVTSGYVKGTRVSATKWNVEINVAIGGLGGRIIIKKSFTPH